MNRQIAFTAAFTALLALGGCTVYPNNPAIGAPPQSATANLKGRAFKIGTVTTAKNVKPVGDTIEHCLPDHMYASMLRHDLQVAFRHEGLTKGTQPAIPVNVAIKYRIFKTNVGLGAGDMAAKVNFAGHSLIAFIKSGGAFGMLNQVPAWQRQRRLIPAITMDVTRGVRNIKQGRAFKAGFAWFGPTSIVHFVPLGNETKRLSSGILYPMPVSQIERITGKSAAQLNAICKARIAGK